MIRVFSIIVLFLGCVWTSKAQSILINGRIKDSMSGEPVENAQIIIPATGEGTVSGEDGFFSLSVSHEFPVELSVIHIAYDKEVLTVQNKKSTGIILYLNPKTTYLDEVTVMGSFENEKPYRTETISAKTITKTSISDIGMLLRREPNVSGVKKGAAGVDPVVRGFKYAQLNVQLDGGIKIEGGCPNRMDPVLAHVDINDVKNISVYKGPFALKYGPNLGGVINVSTYTPRFYDAFENHIEVFAGGQTNHTGFKNSFGVNGGNDVVAYYVKGNYKQYGDYKAGNGEVISSSLEQYNVGGKLAVKPAKGHTVTVGFDRSWGRNVDFPSLPMDERKDDTHIYNISYFGTDFSRIVNYIRFKAYNTHVEHEMDNKNRPFSDTVVAVSQIAANNTGGKFGINLNLWKGRLEAGVDYEQINKDGNRYKYLILQPNLPQVTEGLWNNAVIRNLGVYAEWQRSFTSLDLIAAFRYDYNTANSDTLFRRKMNGQVVYENTNTSSTFNNISFSVGLTWHINESNSLLFSLGRGVRSPDMTERYIILLPVSYDPYDYLGNPQLKPEVNYEADFGYRFMQKTAGALHISVFYSIVENYILGELVPPSQVPPQTRGVLGVKKFINIDRARLMGFEFSYTTPQKYQWFARLNAAYTYGVNPKTVQYIRENGEVVGEQIITNDPLNEIPPFETNISLGYGFFHKKLIPELDIRMVAAQNKVSVANYEQTTPGFVTLGFVLTWQQSDMFTLYAGITNLTNAAYYEHLNRRVIGSKSPLYEPGRMFYVNLRFYL